GRFRSWRALGPRLYLTTPAAPIACLVPEPVMHGHAPFALTVRAFGVCCARTPEASNPAWRYAGRSARSLAHRALTVRKPHGEKDVAGVECFGQLHIEALTSPQVVHAHENI